MSARNFRDLLENQWSLGKFVCVWLDSDLTKVPETAKIFEDPIHLDIEATQLNFNRHIIDETKDLVCAYKPNSAFYEAHGDTGL